MFDNVITIYRIIGRLLTIAGCWKILKKCGKKGWAAILPGICNYRFGVICGQRRDGIYALLFGIVADISQVAVSYVPERSGWFFFLTILFFVSGIAVIFLEYQIIVGMTRVFDADKRLALVWVPASFIPALMLGFMDKYQPVHLGEEDPGEQLAGTTPAALSAARDISGNIDGLSIHLKDRRVRNQGRYRFLLKDIYLTIPNGSLVLLLGGSGAGKTTLVNAVIGYEKANAEIELGTENIYKNYEQLKQADLLTRSLVKEMIMKGEY